MLQSEHCLQKTRFKGPSVLKNQRLKSSLEFKLRENNDFERCLLKQADRSYIAPWRNTVFLFEICAFLTLKHHLIERENGGKGEMQSKELLLLFDHDHL